MILEDKIFEKKRILVTGATGQLGYHIIQRLLNVDGVEVIAMGRNIDKLQKTFFSDIAKKLSLIQHDISIPFNEKLGRLDYIFHAASPISGDIIRKAPLDVIRANLNGTFNCLDYLKTQNKGKMIIFSSATIYPQSFNEATYTEEDCTQAECLSSPTAPYSESKRMIEVIAQAYYKQFGISSLIVRFSYLYGFSPNPAKTSFFEFIDQALKGNNIHIHNTGLYRRDNIYIEDAVDALLHLCSKNYGFEIFNISSNGEGGNFASADEIAECIAKLSSKITGKEVRVIFDCVKENPKNGSLLSNQKLRNSGWKLKTTLEEGIFKTLIKNYEGQYS